MAVIDPEGLFNGDRLRRCSNAAQLHFARLFLASDGFARIEVNYARIIGRAYPTFNPVPSETELHSWIKEYAQNFLLFLYIVDGQCWGQWDTRRELLPRYKTAIDRRSPAPVEADFNAWKRRYRDECKTFPKCFGNISETFLHGVGVGVGGGVEKNICASSDARGGQPPSIDYPTFVLQLEPTQELLQENAPSKTPPKNVKNSATLDGLTPEQETWWCEFWAEYWLKRGKKEGRKAFGRCIKTLDRFQEAMAGLRGQKAEMMSRLPAKRPYPATWLNGERWEDEQNPPMHTTENSTVPREWQL